MTIQGIKDKLQFRKQVDIDTNRLIESVNTVESKIKKEIIDVHEGAEQHPFRALTLEDVNTVQLLADEPFSELYVFWVMAQISLAENNITNFNNEMALFNQHYEEFAAHYKRNNKPLAKPRLSMRGYGV